MKKETRLPTADEIKALVSFLPRLYGQGFNPVIKWEGGNKDANGIIHMPYPVYDPLVEEFIRAASNECWLNYDYDPEEAYQMLKNEVAIKSADLAGIKTILTFIVRGERFSDGHWGEMIEGGYVRRLLERLIELGNK
jgi:hypothetical protein